MPIKSYNSSGWRATGALRLTPGLFGVRLEEEREFQDGEVRWCRAEWPVQIRDRIPGRSSLCPHPPGPGPRRPSRNFTEEKIPMNPRQENNPMTQDHESAAALAGMALIAHACAQEVQARTQAARAPDPLAQHPQTGYMLAAFLEGVAAAFVGAAKFAVSETPPQDGGGAAMDFLRELGERLGR